MNLVWILDIFTEGKIRVGVRICEKKYAQSYQLYS